MNHGFDGFVIAATCFPHHNPVNSKGKNAEEAQYNITLIGLRANWKKAMPTSDNWIAKQWLMANG